MIQLKSREYDLFCNVQGDKDELLCNEEHGEKPDSGAPEGESLG